MAAMLSDLFDPAALTAAIDGGYVKVRHHPELPLSVFNYSEKAVFERTWTPVTRTCRGLVAHRVTGEVVARAFEKFWNAEEPESAGIIQADEPVTVTDKLDGSLGVLVPVDGGHIFATRGSFVSEQAIHATAVWRDRYEGRWAPPPGMTALFEIVYPANRIVVSYDGLDDLVLLGVVDNETGHTFPPSAFFLGWPGPAAEVFPYRSFAEAMAAPPRDNREGLVVHFRESDKRVKIKYSAYVELHKAVTGLNARVVWEHLCTGRALRNLLEPLPDELHPWVVDVADHLTCKVDELRAQVERSYADVVSGLPEPQSRKDFALAAAKHPNSWALFNKLDGRDYMPKLWRQVDPGAEWQPGTALEETAA